MRAAGRVLKVHPPKVGAARRRKVVRPGEEVENLLTDRVEAVGRNFITGERRIGERVADRDEPAALIKALREIALALQLCRHIPLNSRPARQLAGVLL